MSTEKMFVAYYTIIRAEFVRLFRIWTQTFLPPAITTTLYYLIFGQFIGSQIADIQGFSYIQFIVPGLVMMTVITSSFMNASFVIFGAKFQRSIEELLVSPMTPFVIIAGYISASALRGLLTGAIVLGISLFFTHLTIYSIVSVLTFILFTSVLFSLLGLISGIFAKNFDGVSIIPTFVLTPLTYLGGVFYSVEMLPPFWQTVSHFNPILYLVDGFRYGFLGINDISLGASILVLSGAVLAALSVTLYLIRTGKGLRT